MRAQRFGGKSGRLVVAVPGLGANSRCLDYLGERLGGEGFRFVSLDPRGRGRSEATGPGTYGWRRHAEDVLEAGALLGGGPFDLVGHSMGAFVCMQAAAIDPTTLRRVVLLDALGVPDPSAAAAILWVVQSLARPSSSVGEYLDRIRRSGIVRPWNDYWERFFRYDLAGRDGRVRYRTPLRTVIEDMTYTMWRDPRPLWRALTMPVLLLRASRGVVPGAGPVVTMADRDRFLTEIPSATVVDIDANHYGILVHPETASAVSAFLSS